MWQPCCRQKAVNSGFRLHERPRARAPLCRWAAKESSAVIHITNTRNTPTIVLLQELKIYYTARKKKLK